MRISRQLRVESKAVVSIEIQLKEKARGNTNLCSDRLDRFARVRCCEAIGVVVADVAVAFGDGSVEAERRRGALVIFALLLLLLLFSFFLLLLLHHLLLLSRCTDLKVCSLLQMNVEREAAVPIMVQRQHRARSDAAHP